MIVVYYEELDSRDNESVVEHGIMLFDEVSKRAYYHIPLETRLFTMSEDDCIYTRKNAMFLTEENPDFDPDSEEHEDENPSEISIPLDRFVYRLNQNALTFLPLTRDQFRYLFDYCRECKLTKQAESIKLLLDRVDRGTKEIRI